MNLLKVVLFLNICILLSSYRNENNLNNYDTISSIIQKNQDIEVQKDNIEIKTTEANEEIDPILFNMIQEIYDDTKNPTREPLMFSKYIDEQGVYGIIYFDDGRTANRASLAYKEDVDLVIQSYKNGEVGAYVNAIGNYYVKGNEIKFFSSDLTNNLSFDVDWTETDESVIKKAIPSIVEKCKILIETEYEVDVKVFELADDYYAFISGVVNNKEEIEQLDEVGGFCIIFEKLNSHYKIRAVINMN